MEEDGTFLSMSSSSVPSFAQGLKILLVHNDSLFILNLSSMLEKYSFRVTVTDEAKAAVSMICHAEEESQFNLVMAKDNMPDMDTLSFMHFMLENCIPVIFISSGEYNDVTLKALAKGSCFFLEEPILLQDLNYVWQHVYHTKLNLANERTNKQNCINKAHGTVADRKWLKGKEKRNGLEMMNFDRNHLTAFMREDENTEREQNYDEYAERRTRIVWTQELHQKFLDAISVLSETNNIRPKAILEQMNVPYLTARQISSHLQKYKTQELINQKAWISAFTPMATFLNLDGRSQSSSGYPGFPISIAGTTISGNQNQNQCSTIFTETQEVDMLQMEEAVTPIPDEFPTTWNNYGSQNLEAEVEQPMPDALMDQNQAIMRAHDTMKMLEEDCEEHESSQNGLLPHQLDQYCEMLRNALLKNNSPYPQEPDI